MIKPLTVLTAVVLSCTSIASAQPTAPAAAPAPGVDRIKAWEADLDALVRELPAKHKNAFFKCSEETWRARAAEVRSRLGGMSDAQVYAELRRLVALLGDAHTTVYATRDSTLPAQRAFPLAFVWLTDGVYAAILPKEHEALLGRKLVRIGDTPLADAAAKVSELRAYDNESAKMHAVPQDLRDPDALAALGILASAEQGSYTLADAKGGEMTITLAPVLHGSDISSMVVQRPDPGSLPAWRAQRRFPYGHEFFADTGSMYIWYDTCSDHPDKPVSAFIKETTEALDALVAESPQRINRVIVDLRRNSGGNSALFMPMIAHLSKVEFLKSRGRLFCLIGRRTFSSGLMNAYQLRNATECITVGEPTGGSPNHYGEIRSFTLPNSKLNVQYSTKFFRGSEQDTDALYPDLQVAPWSKAYFDGRDVVLERVLKWAAW